MNIIAKLAVFIFLSALSGMSLANAPVQPEGPSAVMQLIFFGGFILIFYFLMWRPQSKRAKEHRELVSGLNKGDEVVTNGGIAGKITEITQSGQGRTPTHSLQQSFVRFQALTQQCP